MLWSCCCARIPGKSTAEPCSGPPHQRTHLPGAPLYISSPRDDTQEEHLKLGGGKHQDIEHTNTSCFLSFGLVTSLFHDRLTFSADSYGAEPLWARGGCHPGQQASSLQAEHTRTRKHSPTHAHVCRLVGIVLKVSGNGKCLSNSLSCIPSCKWSLTD